MFLGILILVVALVVVYFESKSREQNHKIASMLSLVSTLAEDMNGVKMGLHHLSMNRVGGNNLQQFPQHVHSSLEESDTLLFQSNSDNLINVSDDESDDSDDDIDDNSDDESNGESDGGINNDSDGFDENDADSDEESEDNHPNIKILKVDINKDINDIDCDECEESDECEEIDVLEELNEIEELDEETNIQLSNKSVLELLSNHSNDNNEGSNINILATDLKTININLEEPLTDSLDYKKLPIPRLRSLVTEKMLASASDASKMKKWELIKLLEDS